MINLTSKGKKLLLPLVLLLLVITTPNLKAQKLEFTIKIDSTIVNDHKEYAISIEIISGNGPYSYFLCDKIPWVGGTVLEQYIDIQSPKYVFTKLSQINNYVVFVKGSGKAEYIWKSVSAKNEKK